MLSEKKVLLLPQSFSIRWPVLFSSPVPNSVVVERPCVFFITSLDDDGLSPSLELIAFVRRGLRFVAFEIDRGLVDAEPSWVEVGDSGPEILRTSFPSCVVPEGAILWLGMRSLFFGLHLSHSLV
jgi:hypothetical protein